MVITHESCMQKRVVKSLLIGILALSCWNVALAQSTEQDELDVYEHSVATNPFWHNWYVQLGADMSLQNPYGMNFVRDVFPNGKTYGINVAAGKWITPEFGMRFVVNWDNWLIKNNHLSWVAPFGRNGKNFSKGGFGFLVGELHFNLTNLFCGYDGERLWHITFYPRAGLVSNIALGSCSPLVGLGFLNTWKLTPKLSAYFDVSYQMTTSEFVNSEVNTGMGTGSNGFADLSIGIILHVGRSGFKKLVNEK